MIALLQDIKIELQVGAPCIISIQRLRRFSRKMYAELFFFLKQLIVTGDY